MNPEDTGIGAGVGGLLATIFMALGFKSRIDRIEDRNEARDKNYSELLAKVSEMVGSCSATHKSLNDNVVEMKDDIKKLLNRRRADREDGQG